ncbi:MAG: NAD(P)-binding domain-containing protein [Thermomicrobiales bacterium]
MSSAKRPVVVIGAGPVGLAAAAHLLEQGEEPLVLEQGSEIAANVRQWQHVRFFSPWKYVVDDASARLLEPTGWIAPDEDLHPTGADILSSYLTPLAAHPAIASRVRLGHHVVAVGREGFDKTLTPGRNSAPYRVTFDTADGEQDSVLAKAVIDASGTWTAPNPLGGAGVPAVGEAAARDRIAYGIPDVLDRQRSRYAGKRVLVVGSGHSAFNVLLDLATLIEETGEGSLVWAVRRSGRRLEQAFGGGDSDGLPARGQLGLRVRELVDAGRLQLVSGFKAARVEETADGLVVSSRDQALPPVDEVIVSTGFRPDLSIMREVRVDLDPALEAPRRLAPMIDPNVHSCGSVPPHGADELKHPDPDFYIAGMKSYGRAPTFLLLTGYEQVRSIACAITGNWAAAREVKLVLPETGVCSTDLGEAGGSCCGTADASAESSDVRIGGCCDDSPAGCCTSTPQLITLTRR